MFLFGLGMFFLTCFGDIVSTHLSCFLYFYDLIYQVCHV